MEAYTFDSEEDHTAFLDACSDRGSLAETWVIFRRFGGLFVVLVALILKTVIEDDFFRNPKLNIV